jgi:hypothetical protein
LNAPLAGLDAQAALSVRRGLLVDSRLGGRVVEHAAEGHEASKLGGVLPLLRRGVTPGRDDHVERSALLVLVLLRREVEHEAPERLLAQLGALEAQPLDGGLGVGALEREARRANLVLFAFEAGNDHEAREVVGRLDRRTRLPLTLLVVDGRLELLLGVWVLRERRADPFLTEEVGPALGDRVGPRDVGLARVAVGGKATLLVVGRDEADRRADAFTGQRVDELASLGVAVLNLTREALADLVERDYLERLSVELGVLLRNERVVLLLGEALGEVVALGDEVLRGRDDRSFLVVSGRVIRATE